MHSLSATRVILLCGDSLFLGKFSGFSRVAPLYSSVRFICRVGNGNEPLTLETLGLSDKLETTEGNEKNKLTPGISTIEVPKRREKKVGQRENNAVQMKKKVGIEALAPFAENLSQSFTFRLY